MGKYRNVRIRGMLEAVRKAEGKGWKLWGRNLNWVLLLRHSFL